MTNARQSRQRNAREQRLVDERNALLDVLNAVLNMAGDRDGLLAIPLEFYLGQPRHPVYTIPTSQGVILKLDRDQALSDEGVALLVMPEVVEMPEGKGKSSLADRFKQAVGVG